MTTDQEHEKQAAASRIRLATLMRAVQWDLDDTAHRLPEQRITADDCIRLAEKMSGVSKLLQHYADGLENQTITIQELTPALSGSQLTRPDETDMIPLQTSETDYQRTGIGTSEESGRQRKS